MSFVGKLILIFISITMIYNQLLIVNISNRLGTGGFLADKINDILYSGKKNVSLNREVKLTGDLRIDVLAIISVKGEPGLYGKLMGVSFDKVQESIDIMKIYDPRKGSFGGNEYMRYVNITSKISCEFCCTVKMLTNNDGSSTCDCDHAKALRGLAFYLLKNHGNDYSDTEILRELSKWKSAFYPKQMAEKIIHQIKENNYSPDIEALLNGIKLPAYDFSKEKESEIENIPDMVGGC